jgi:CheY-like chemotaxis protein
MPLVDGFMLANAIKSIEKIWFKELTEPDDIRRFKTKKRCPVVAITASDPKQVIEEATKAGILRVIKKPINIEEMTAVI